MAREVAGRADDHQGADDGPTVGDLGEQQEPGQRGERQPEEVERGDDRGVHDPKRAGHRERRHRAADR